MKKFIGFLIFLAVVAGVMFVTCPDKEKHVDKVSEDVLQYVREDVSNGENGGLMEIVIDNAVVGSISENLVRLYVKSQLKVEEFAVINIGKMRYEGEDHTVSIGAFNHVFSLVKTYKMMGDIKK